MKCLVVEPSPSVRRSVIRSLQGLPDLELLASDDPATTLSELQPPVDLAVIGWAGENELGIELLRALRQHPQLGGIPVLILSPRGSYADVRSAIAAGATDYVLRPAAAGVLAERVSRLLASDAPPEQQAA